MIIHRQLHVLTTEIQQSFDQLFDDTMFQAGRNVRDLFEDLRDGHNLLSLLEVLSGEILVSFIINKHATFHKYPRYASLSSLN